MAFVGEHPEWEGTPSELLTKLESVAEQEKIDIREKLWPKSPVWLTRRLNEVKTNLLDAGVRIQDNREGKARTILIERRSDFTVTTVTSVTDLQKQGVTGDGNDDSRNGRGNTVTDTVSNKLLKNNVHDGNDANDSIARSEGVGPSLLEGRI